MSRRNILNIGAGIRNGSASMIGAEPMKLRRNISDCSSQMFVSKETPLENCYFDRVRRASQYEE